MAVTRVPVLRFDLNGANISTSILQHLISITIEDIFDTNFTVSKMSIEVSAKFGGRWEYKDQIKLYLSWSTKPSEVLTSNIFYVDYIDDSKQNGNQSYLVNALEADLDLGFTYGGSGKITLTNKTVKGWVGEFANEFGLTLTEAMGSNVVIGTIPIPDNYQVGQPLPNNNTVSKTFDSKPQVIKWICSTFGYFGNLSGKDLQIYRLESQLGSESDYAVPNFDSILDFQVDSKYTDLYKLYTTVYARNNDRVLDIYDLPNSFSVSNKNIDFLDEGAYYNLESGKERAYGVMNQDYLNSFKARIKSVGFPTYKAGKIFYLNETYGGYVGAYRTIKVVHNITANDWMADIEGFPLSLPLRTDTSFKGEFLGTVIIVPDFNYTQTISSSMPTTLNGTWLDNFAKSLNSAYNQTLGATYITEGDTEGVRYDIAFCQMLVETNNWKESTRISRFNPGGIGTASGSGGFHTFSNWQQGIRGQIQHLQAFSTTTKPLVNAVVDPRYNQVTRGSATRVIQLTNRWTSSASYGDAILAKLRAMYIFLGYKNPTLTN